MVVGVNGVLQKNTLWSDCDVLYEFMYVLGPKEIINCVSPL